VKDKELSLILFPHGAPADPTQPEKEHKENDTRCMLYVDAFDVPVVYVNCIGKLEYIPGMMGSMMEKHGFRMNGMCKIYSNDGEEIKTELKEAIGIDVSLNNKKKLLSMEKIFFRAIGY